MKRRGIDTKRTWISINRSPWKPVAGGSPLLHRVSNNTVLFAEASDAGIATPPAISDHLRSAIPASYPSPSFTILILSASNDDYFLRKNLVLILVRKPDVRWRSMSKDKGSSKG